MMTMDGVKRLTEISEDTRRNLEDSRTELRNLPDGGKGGILGIPDMFSRKFHGSRFGCNDSFSIFFDLVNFQYFRHNLSSAHRGRGSKLVAHWGFGRIRQYECLTVYLGL